MVNQNVGRGVLLIAVSLFFLVQAPRLTIGSLSRPGPGLFPVMVASGLLFLALVMIVRSRFIEAVPLDFHFRNIALIAGALLCFARPFRVCEHAGRDRRDGDDRVLRESLTSRFLAPRPSQLPSASWPLR